VYEATFNRDHIVAQQAFRDVPEGVEIPDVEEMQLGVREREITTAVDVSPWVTRKRAAMAAHASQITETSFFLSLPDDAFLAGFGTEWFIRHGRDPGRPWETDLFEGIDA
jgi:LmbE family N-acetylglucosaminyl deacetylase